MCLFRTLLARPVLTRDHIHDLACGSSVNKVAPPPRDVVEAKAFLASLVAP
jgi:hypothetical protein